MQSDDDKTQWQQPTDRGGPAPYAPTADDEASSIGPVVSLSPDSQPEESPSGMIDEASTEGEELLDTPIVRWQAHEYIHREKNATWYAIFAVIVILLITVAVFLMESITFAVLIVVMAAALVVYSGRPPHTIDYTLSRQGLHTNDHLYPFVEFKGFSVIHGDEEYSIMLVPVKRFKPGVTIYFPEDKGEAIVDVMAARLPMEESRVDFIDRLIKMLRI